ncbi:MAG: carbohydrate ABC transporter permease [Defluviitaleaceae bacterium]|nr:carbohydrate ABC transporter permease [Defluviitaleaceae bacterium]
MTKTANRLPNLEKLEKREITKAKLVKKLMGSREKNGLVMDIVIYTLLITIGFVYLYPLLHMLATSFMNPGDLLDSGVQWIPSTLNTANYSTAVITMDYWRSLASNLQIAFFPTVLQVVVTSMAGYAFARYDFPLKRLWLFVLIFSFVIPPQITMIPTFVLYNDLNLVGSIGAFVIPALLGQGFQSAIFILIFYNFHRQVPHSLIEAAEIDGAGHLSSFFRISMPLAIPALVVTTLFSFVWYWNEIFLIDLYLGLGNTRDIGLTTLMLELQRFQASHGAVFGGMGVATPDPINEALRMAGTMMAIAPLLLLYLVLQRQFVQSIDKAGITGE